MVSYAMACVDWSSDNRDGKRGVVMQILLLGFALLSPTR